MRAPHKLAAVLFADIAGYTAIMADSEDLALKKLTIFKKQLNKALLLNSGQLVQYFGDGALCTFESSAKAIDCAIQLQNGLKKGAIVPVRIGIHTGDVVFKEGNVYGDAVNIASRIESIGKPGTILVSSSVRNQVKSTPTFNFKSLGKIQFKNVTDPIEVFALTGKGFKVPSRKHIKGKIVNEQPVNKNIPGFIRKAYITAISIVTLLVAILILGGDQIVNWRLKSSLEDVSEEGLVIFDFKNETGDPSYDYLQCRVHDQLTERFLKQKIKIRNNSTICRRNNYYEVVKSQVSPGLQLQNLIGSKYALEGSFYFTLGSSDSITFQASVFKTMTNEVLLKTNDISTHISEIDEGIIRLSREIQSFWKLKDDPIFSVETPLPGWYEEYSKAIYYFEKDPDKVLYHLRRCEEIDPTAHRADILEIEVYSIYGMVEKIDSVIEVLQKKADELSSGETNLLNVHKAIRNKNNQAAFEYYKNEFKKSPKDPFINFAMMSYAVMFNNDTRYALKVAEEIPFEYIDYNNCSFCQDRLTIMARAMIDEEKYNEALRALQYAYKMESGVQNAGNVELQIRAMIRNKDEKQLHQLLEESRYKEFSRGRNYAYFLYWTSNEFTLIGDNENAAKFRNSFLKEIGPEPSLGHKIRTARLNINFGEFVEAESLLMEILNYQGLSDYLHNLYSGLMGYVKGKLGKIGEAENIIRQLKSKEIEYARADVAYLQGQVLLGCGDEDLALDHIKESILNGKHFTRWEFQHDPLFIEIQKNPLFLDMINQLN